MGALCLAGFKEWSTNEQEMDDHLPTRQQIAKGMQNGGVESPAM